MFVPTRNGLLTIVYSGETFLHFPCCNGQIKRNLSNIPVIFSRSSLTLCSSFLHKNVNTFRLGFKKKKNCHSSRKVTSASNKILNGGIQIHQPASVKNIVKVVALFVGTSVVAILVNGFRTLALAYSFDENDSSSFSGGGGGGGGSDGTGGGGWGSSGGSSDGSGSGRNVETGNSWTTVEKEGREKEKSGEETDMGVTIIVPTLNEEATIANTLQRLKSLNPSPIQVIVVDGGSADGTAAIAKRCGATVVRSNRGRAVQLNSGAQKAMEFSSGAEGILCFLHADTTVPLDLVRVIRKTMADKQTVCGGFVPVITVPGRVLWGMSLHNTVKTWYGPLLLRPLAFMQGLRCLFGDQTIFCRAKDFVAVQGFKEELSIMEDINLCERLHYSVKACWPWLRRGRVRMVNRAVETSGRRMLKFGTIRATYVQVVIGFSYAFGCTPKELDSLYKNLYIDVR